MDYNHRLVLLLSVERGVVLLHSLQEECSVHAELEDAAQTCHLVITERKPVQRKLWNRFLVVMVARLSAQIVNLAHAPMPLEQEPVDVLAFVSVYSF